MVALLFAAVAAVLAQAAHVSDRAARPDIARALAHAAALLIVAAVGVFVAAWADR